AASTDLHAGTLKPTPFARDAGRDAGHSLAAAAAGHIEVIDKFATCQRRDCFPSWGREHHQPRDANSFAISSINRCLSPALRNSAKSSRVTVSHDLSLFARCTPR